jgi:hypothetical protein
MANLARQYLELPMELRLVICDFLFPDLTDREDRIVRRKNGTVAGIFVGSDVYHFYRSGQVRYVVDELAKKMTHYYWNGIVCYRGGVDPTFLSYERYGRLYRPDGKLLYTGMFELGEFSGDGYYFFPDGRTYIHAIFRPKFFGSRDRKRMKKYDHRSYYKYYKR